jgi:ERCC4-type nuclease
MAYQSEFPIFNWGDPVDHTNRVISDKPIFCPFTVVIDTREQAPWAFRGFRGDARQKFRPLVIQTVRAGLRSGDYSIQGCEHRISVERKSLADAFSTFTQERDRFERELLRLSDMDFAAVVIEGGWQDLIDGPSKPDKSELHSEVIGKTVYRSILAWSQRFPRIHWFPMPSRSQAEDTAFRLLERWWLDEEYKIKKGDW